MLGEGRIEGNFRDLRLGRDFLERRRQRTSGRDVSRGHARRVEGYMTKAIRLTVALMAALAFTAAWADATTCGAEDVPCAAAEVQDGSSTDSSGSLGSGSGELSSGTDAMDDLYQQNLQYEYWQQGG
jgi:hypothetical protein